MTDLHHLINAETTKPFKYINCAFCLMTSLWVDLCWKPFSHSEGISGSTRHARGNSSSFGSSTQDCLKHPLQISDLTCYSTELFKALCASVTIISKRTLQRDSQACISSRALCYGNGKGSKTTSNSDYRNSVCWWVYFPHHSTSTPLEKVEGVFFCLFVCFKGQPSLAKQANF